MNITARASLTLQLKGALLKLEQSTYYSHRMPDKMVSQNDAVVFEKDQGIAEIWAASNADGHFHLKQTKDQKRCSSFT